MICRIEDVKNSCSIILSAVDSGKVGQTSDLLEMIVENEILYLAVTNKESYVRVRVCTCDDKDFHATVNASNFLSLVSKTSTDTIQFEIKDTFLYIKSNGNYKLPLVYEGSSMLTLPTIPLLNVTSSFDIDSSILNSLFKYNSKQINIGVSNTLIQKLYYIDEKGALTFTSGACINTFTLKKPIKLLFNDRLVKLFRLFNNEQVKFSLAQDALGEFVQTKVRFETPSVDISYILFCDDKLLNSVPVSSIRNLANDTYEHQVVVSKVDLLECIDRLCIFANDKDSSVDANIEFTDTELRLSFMENTEDVSFKNTCPSLMDEAYSTIISLSDLRQILSAMQQEFVTIKFGNEKCFVICIPNIEYIIPETRIS